MLPFGQQFANQVAFSAQQHHMKAKAGGTQPASRTAVSDFR
jgi:hypothetical protein